MGGSSPGMTNRRQRRDDREKSGQSAPLLRRRRIGRRARGRWGGRGPGRGSLLFHNTHGDNRAFVQQQQGNGERGLAQDVGRGQHGGNNEGDNDEVAPFIAQLLGGDDADPS